MRGKSLRIVGMDERGPFARMLCRWRMTEKLSEAAILEHAALGLHVIDIQNCRCRFEDAMRKLRAERRQGLRKWLFERLL
jgi:hypothetical protein